MYISEHRNIAMILIETTQKCNLECKYCYNRKQYIGEDLEFEIIKKVIDDLVENNYRPCISLSGGEYLVRADFEEILKYLDNKVDISIITNGILLTNKIINILERYNIDNIQISLDGLSDIENSLRSINSSQILKNITLLLNSKFKNNISIRTTVHKLNYQNIIPLFDYVTDNKIEIRLGYLDFVKENNYTNSYILDKDEILAFVNLLNNYNLLNKTNIKEPDISAGGVCGLIDDDLPLNLKLNVNGDIFACQAAQTKEFMLGNIKEKSIVDASDNQALLKLKNIIKMRKSIMGEKCLSCLVYNNCIGKCIANISNETGSIFSCIQRYREVAEEIERN